LIADKYMSAAGDGFQYALIIVALFVSHRRVLLCILVIQNKLECT
jgi:hypothetical protein